MMNFRSHSFTGAILDKILEGLDRQVRVVRGDLELSELRITQFEILLRLIDVALEFCDVATCSVMSVCESRGHKLFISIDVSRD